MILTADQQRWCAEHTLGSGFDDDNPDLVQYTHVCEFIGGDGDAPRPKLAEHMTRKKLVRVRRTKNAYARLLSRGSGRTIDERDGETGEIKSVRTTRESAHYWRRREDEDPGFETRFSSDSPLCDGCYAWIGSFWHRCASAVHSRSLKYCRPCVESGASDRDYERRTTAKARREQSLAHEPQRSVALCRSPRLWCGSAAQPWPALDMSRNAEARDNGSAHWANITCVDCIRILRERAPEVFVPHVPIG